MAHVKLYFCFKLGSKKTCLKLNFIVNCTISIESKVIEIHFRCIVTKSSTWTYFFLLNVKLTFASQERILHGIVAKRLTL